MSDESDVRAQLQDRSFIRKNTLEYELAREAGLTVGLFTWQAGSERYNRIILRDNIVLRMEIWVDHDWTLGDVVNKFGPPECVSSYRYGEEVPGYHVEFYYPAQGVEFESSTYPFKKAAYRITRDLQVTLGVYFAPTSLVGMMSEAYLCPPEKMETCLGDISGWEGSED